MSFTKEHTDTILDYIKKIEEKHDIEIILAVDNGSRSMDIHTPESDYDIRFIFIHNRRAKHITHDYMDSTNTFFEDGLYDFDGWSIDKAIKHLKESNPSLIEWLHSPVVFVDKYDFRKDCLDILYQMHNKLSMFYHYSSMAFQNYTTWIKNKDKVLYKKYVYVVRPIMMVMYLNMDENNSELIVTKVRELHDKVKHMISDDINECIVKVIKLKQQMKGIEGDPILELNDWIDNKINEIDKMKEKKSKKKGDNMSGRAVISCYSKMCNEVRKLLAISNKSIDSCINRVNYLSAIFSVLEFLWVWNSKEEKKDMPTSISGLLSTIPDVPESISEHLKHVSNFKNTVTVDESVLESKKTIHDVLIPGIVNLVKLIDSDADVSKLETLDRDDVYEYIINYALSVYYVSLKSGSKLRDIPTDILTDKNNFGEEFHSKVVTLLRSMRSVYIMKIIPELNEWLKEMVEKFKESVKEYSVKLQKIKEINVKERYKNTMKSVDKEVFTTLVEKILFK